MLTGQQIKQERSRVKAVTEMEDMPLEQATPLAAAKWIWLAQDQTVVNQYVCFRKRIHLDHVANRARMDISADSDFRVWINGRLVGGGQFSDWPKDKTFTHYDLAGHLREGDNTIAVMAYYRGEDFSDYCTGQPGLIAAIDLDGRVVATDGSWKVRQHASLISGPMPRVTGQMGFTWQYDARREEPWLEPSFDDSHWSGASEICGASEGYWKTLAPRPVPPLRVLDECPVVMTAHGDFRRTLGEGTFAQIMYADLLVNRSTAEMFTPLPPKAVAGYARPTLTHSTLIARADDQWLELQPPPQGADGRYLVLDLGREEVGYLVLRLDAPATAVLDIGHGEHLDDGRVRMACGYRNFADRYICKEGLNEFTFPFRRIGARFLQVHIWDFTQPLRINYIGLAPTELPLADGGRFKTHDVLAQRMCDVADRTLQLCMHEHYEDSPWREQSLYAFDSRNQALYGYYSFGNYDFAQASIDLLGRGIRQDGLLRLTAPGNAGVTIPIFSLVWISELAEHWLHSGRPGLFRKFAAQVQFMLETVFGRRDDVTGLYRIPGGKGMWNYYDWMDGLAGSGDAENSPDVLHAPFNLFLLEAMQSCEWMLRQEGRIDDAAAIAARSQSLRDAVFQNFWDSETGALATYMTGGRRSHFCDLVQVLAIKTGVVLPECRQRVLEHLYSRKLVPMALSPLLYQWLALMDSGAYARGFCAETLARNFEPMVLQGASSLWETQLGSADFSNAGSLCHGWSALATYHYHAHVLGVRPVESGFRRFIISPFPDRLYQADGAVPTPAGPIRIAWRKTDCGLVVLADGPDELEPVAQPLEEAPIVEATYNNRRLLM